MRRELEVLKLSLKGQNLVQQSICRVYDPKNIIIGEVYGELGFSGEKRRNYGKR